MNTYTYIQTHKKQMTLMYRSGMLASSLLVYFEFYVFYLDLIGVGKAKAEAQRIAAVHFTTSPRSIRRAISTMEENI